MDTRAAGTTPLRIVAVLLLLALLATGAEAERRAPVQEDETTRAPIPLTVRGHVRGLYPGAWTGMRVTVVNHNDRPIDFDRVLARVARARPGCGRRYLVVRGSHRERLVPPHGRIRLRLKVRLRRTAPDACQGARFPITFTTGDAAR
jgi:hypothetical protein